MNIIKGKIVSCAGCLNSASHSEGAYTVADSVGSKCLECEWYSNYEAVPKVTEPLITQKCVGCDAEGCLGCIDNSKHRKMALSKSPPLKEVDPSGKGAHETGAKLDAGKPRVSLVLGGFSKALLAVAEVGTYGAEKYTDNGWKDVGSGVERYTDAMGRHALYEAGGEVRDRDTGLLHASHLAWNALARLELLLREENG